MKKITILIIILSVMVISPMMINAVSINFVMAIYSALDDEGQKFEFTKQQEKDNISYWLGTNKFKKSVIGLFGKDDTLKSAMLVGYPSTEKDLTLILSNMNGLMYFFTKDENAANWLLECIKQFAKGETPEPYVNDEVTASFYIEEGSLNLELYFNKYFTK